MLVSPGVYHEAVVVTTPFVTVHGADRNRVVLDGGFDLDNGIHVIEADGVAIENMTARRYRSNGFLWSRVFGYRGSYLTAYDDGANGLFAFESAFGQFDHSYASGHPDAGFSIGRCDPCHAVVTNVTAERNALGFSGMNASGDASVVNSEWPRNMAGILPSTLDGDPAPQHDLLIAGNVVHDNDNRGAPARALRYPAFGIGIGVAGDGQRRGGKRRRRTRAVRHRRVPDARRHVVAGVAERRPRQPRLRFGHGRSGARRAVGGR